MFYPEITETSINPHGNLEPQFSNGAAKGELRALIRIFIIRPYHHSLMDMTSEPPGMHRFMNRRYHKGEEAHKHSFAIIFNNRAQC